MADYIFYSRYVFVILIMLFVLFSFKDIIYNKRSHFPFFIIIIFHIMAYSILYSKFGINAIYFAMLSFLFFIGFKYITYILYKRADSIIVNSVIFLIDISFVNLYNLENYLAFKQIIALVIGLFLISLLPMIFYFISKLFSNHKNFVELVFLSLFIVLISLPSFIGEEKFGAYNWITIFGIQFQPSEVCKFLFIFYISLTFNKAMNISRLILPSFIAFLSVLILISQNDLGGALIFFVIYMMMMYVASGYTILFIGGFIVAGIVSYLGYDNFEHVSVRVEAWLNPLSDPMGGGYQILQSLYAIGSYGPFGAGLTNGMPSTIPVAESDLIFSVICEEFGGLFGIGLILVIFTIFCRSCILAKDTSKKYLTIMCIGVGVLLTFQSFLIIGGVTKLIPLTGVTLPFVSYGGTSAIVSMLMVGILLYISAINKYEYEKIVTLRMSKTINRVFIIFAILYLFLIMNLFYFIFFEYEDIIDNDYNLRIESQI